MWYQKLEFRTSGFKLYFGLLGVVKVIRVRYLNQKS